MRAFSQSTQGQQQNRRFYLALPVLILPFLTMIYWALVVKNIKPTGQQSSEQQGLNPSLPPPFFKEEKNISKLNFYQKAALDSAKKQAYLKNDPYRQQIIETQDQLPSTLMGLNPEKNDSLLKKTPKKMSAPLKEQQLIDRLKALDRALSKSSQPEFKEPVASDAHLIPPAAALEPATDTFESVDSIDPEMAQINQALDKILAIQHPETIGQLKTVQPQKGALTTLPALSADNQMTISSLSSLQSKDDSLSVMQVSTIENNGFFGLESSQPSGTQMGFSAVVHSTQTISADAIVKLRLCSDILVGNVLIPKDSFLYARASLTSERVQLQVSSIRKENMLYSVDLTAYDMDGQAGVYIPGSLPVTTSKQTLGQDIQSVDLGSFDTSLGAQAASAGIKTAKTLLSKKTRMPQVTLPDGYQILLFDKKGIL